jgi:hypothetical protein
MDIEVGTNKVYYFTVSEKKEKLAQNPPVSAAHFSVHPRALFVFQGNSSTGFNQEAGHCRVLGKGEKDGTYKIRLIVSKTTYNNVE